MKKVNLLLTSLMVLSACSSPKKENETPKVSAQPSEPTVVKQGYQIGTATVTGIQANDVVDGKGNVTFTTTSVALALDSTDRIVYIDFDVAENKVEADKEGKLSASETSTKRSLAQDYGMKKVSSINKEWFEQMDAFEEKLIGKTLDEAMALPLSDDGKAADADVLSGCTIHVGGFIELIEKASANLFYAENISKLGLGMDTSFNLKDVKDGKGSAEANTNIAFYGVDANDNIVFTYIDVAQNSAELNGEGHWSVKEPTTTKRELGENYGLIKASSIGKEWFEQVDAFQAYSVGKPLDSLFVMELDNGKTTDVDLLSSCTIGLSGYLKALEIAKQYAKAI